MPDIVILGAGLTGLSAAYHLEQKGFYNYELFEKESDVGGLCRSVQVDGFTFDYTGHLLHINDDYFHAFIKEHIGFENLNAIARRSYVYSQDRYTKYPYQINLKGLPTDTIIKSIEDFVGRPSTRNIPHTFAQWATQSFGKTIARNFFFPFDGKKFDYSVHRLSASWTGRFVPPTTLEQILKGALVESEDEQIGYNARFWYPLQGGIFFWVHKLYQLLQKPVHTNKRVTRIYLKEQRVEFADGTYTDYKQLISTLPLNAFIQLIDEPANSFLKTAQSKLLCNKVINFNLGINKPDISDKHWIYFPEMKYPFYRLGFCHNFSPYMAPLGCSSLYGEFAVLNRSQKTIDALLKTSLKQTKELLHLHDQDIAVEKIITIPHAYVIFNAWRDKNLPHILSNLEKQNIYSIGRYGAWKYASMQEGLLDGKKIVERLLVLPAQYENDILMPSKQKNLEKSL
jgi:protoporphyrinogen oxidase